MNCQLAVCRYWLAAAGVSLSLSPMPVTVALALSTTLSIQASWFYRAARAHWCCWMAHQEVALRLSASILSCSLCCCTYQAAARIFPTGDHASSTTKRRNRVVFTGHSVTTTKFAAELVKFAAFSMAAVTGSPSATLLDALIYWHTP